MTFDNILIPILFITPQLLIICIYLLIRFYKNYNEQLFTIQMLSDSQANILDNNKKNELNIEEISSLSRKLLFAGYKNDNADKIFLFISITFGTLLGFFMYYISNSILISICVSLISGFLPLLVLNKIITNRIEEFNFGLNLLIEKVTSMMRSGVGFEQAFKKAIITNKSPFTKEIMNIYLKEKDIIGEDKAFEKMFKYVESKELRIFYLTISIGKQSGGKFSNTLDVLKKTLQAQGTIKKEITSSTREIKIGTYLIISLTVGIFFMMNGVFNGALVEHFFYTDDGKIQMFFIVLWVGFGLFVNSLLTKIKG